VSTTIKKYLYVAINDRLDNKIRLVYSNMETIDNINDIKHDFIRETLKFLTSLLGVGVEIVITSNIPAKGTGLGSSAATIVGALNALEKWAGYYTDPEFLASNAFKIEHDRLATSLKEGRSIMRGSSMHLFPVEQIKFQKMDFAPLVKKIFDLRVDF